MDMSNVKIYFPQLPNTLNTNSAANIHHQTPPANAKHAAPNNDDYENIKSDYRLATPTRPPPSVPTQPPHRGHNNNNNNGSSTPLANAAATNTKPQPFVVQHHTLGTYSDIDGVPFTLNARLLPDSGQPKEREITAAMFDVSPAFGYNFQLERQVLCSIKTSTSKNPFFQKADG